MDIDLMRDDKLFTFYDSDDRPNKYYKSDNMRMISESEACMIFKENLEYEMNKVGVSSARLSRDSGLSKSTITRYLSGTRLPNYKAIVNLCYALDCEPEDLINMSSGMIE